MAADSEDIVIEVLPTKERLTHGLGIEGTRKGMSKRTTIRTLYKRGKLGPLDRPDAKRRLEAAEYFAWLHQVATESQSGRITTNWDRFMDRNRYANSNDPERGAFWLAAQKERFRKISNSMIEQCYFGPAGRDVLNFLMNDELSLARIEQVCRFSRDMAGNIFRRTLDDLCRVLDSQGYGQR